MSASVGAVLKPAGLDKSVGPDLDRTTSRTRPTRSGRSDPAYEEWLAFMNKYYPDGDLIDAFNVYGYARRADRWSRC